MFTTEDVIGDIVFISFRDNERYLDIGIKETSGHFLVKGFDNMGVWVKHPGLVVVHSDDNGKPLPSKDLYKEEIGANFMISWDNIKTIMHYPERDGYDFPSEFDRNIGFKLKK